MDGESADRLNEKPICGKCLALKTVGPDKERCAARGFHSDPRNAHPHALADGSVKWDLYCECGERAAFILPQRPLLWVVIDGAPTPAKVVLATPQ